jgi:hypothetical protein
MLILSSFFITEVAPNIFGDFFPGMSSVLILTKIGCDAFWAIFSQTHLVALRLKHSRRKRNHSFGFQ